MATIRLIPSTYYLSNTSYLSVSNTNNMYANTDSTTYATVTNTRNNSTTSYYLYLRGFNFNDIPSDAIINSFQIKIKGYHTGGNTGTIGLYNGTTQVTNGGSAPAFDTSVSTNTFTGLSIDFDTLKNYGDDLGIRINCRRASRNTTSYVYIYGAEIEVDYTIPIYHTVSATSNSQTVTIEPSTQSIIEGTSASVCLRNVSDISAITVRDNGTDVTQSLVVAQGGSETFNPSSYDSEHSTVSTANNVENGLNSYSNTEVYATFRGTTNNTYYVFYNFENIDIPSDATNINVSCVFRACSYSTYYWAGVLCKGTTEISDRVQINASSQQQQTPSTSDIFTITSSSFSYEDLQSIKLKLTQTVSGRYYFWFFGADLTITYTVPEGTYTYTISNVQTDHTIVVEDNSSSSSKKSYVKKNNAFVESTNQYVKETNSWVNRTISKIFWKINGNWTETNDSMSGKTAFKIDV